MLASTPRPAQTNQGPTATTGWATGANTNPGGGGGGPQASTDTAIPRYNQTPQEEAAVGNQQWQGAFNIANSLASIMNMPALNDLQRQADFAGQMARMAGGGDGSAGFANQNAGLQRAILDIANRQLGLDQNTIKGQQALTYENLISGGRAWENMNKYLAGQRNLAVQLRNQKMGYFDKVLRQIAGMTNTKMQEARQHTGTQRRQFGYDVGARGAWGASGTQDQLGAFTADLQNNLKQLTQARNQQQGQVRDSRSTFLNDFAKQIATNDKQKFDALTDWKNLQSSAKEKFNSLGNAYSKIGMEQEANRIRQQQASVAAQQAAASAAFGSAMQALQYQQQQAGLQSQIGGMGAQNLQQAMQFLPYLQGMTPQQQFGFLMQMNPGAANWFNALPQPASPRAGTYRGGARVK